MFRLLWTTQRVERRSIKVLTLGSMVIARRFFVTRYFEGEPQRRDFKLVEYELPQLREGDILVKAEWISVDPYMRSFNKSYIVPYKEFGYQVGIVQESRHPDYPVGTHIVSHQGWCDYYIMNPDVRVSQFDFGTVEFGHYKLPDLQGLPISYGIGAVGMPGATAYFGFLEICKPNPGETVVVTTAAGAVGSIVGQIAKIKGCRVIGFASSDEKAQWLEQDLGYDKAFNYKSVDVTAVLKNAAPNGIDCYFDNVGGELSFLIMHQMNRYGRVAICGTASTYKYDSIQESPAYNIQPLILAKQLTVQGFVVFRWIDQWPEAFQQIITWIKSGQLKVREQVTEGLENVIDAFKAMLAGKNFGKVVVKI